MANDNVADTPKISAKQLGKTKAAVYNFLASRSDGNRVVSISRRRIIQAVKRDELLVREALRQMHADGTLEIVRNTNEHGMNLPAVYRLKGE